MTPSELNDLHRMPKDKLIEFFSQCCQDGNLKAIEYICKNPIRKLIAFHDNIETFMMDACVHHQIEVIQFLFSSKVTKEHTYSQSHYNCVKKSCELGHLDVIKTIFKNKSPHCLTDEDEFFRYSARWGQVHIVEYFLNRLNNKSNDDLPIHSLNDYSLRVACLYGHFNVIQFLLTSTTLKEHANIYAINESNQTPFLNACQYGGIHIIKYLLQSPDLKENVDIRKNFTKSLALCCIGQHFDLFLYLLEYTKEHHSSFYILNETSIKDTIFTLIPLSFLKRLNDNELYEQLQIKEHLYDIFCHAYKRYDKELLTYLICDKLLPINFHIEFILHSDTQTNDKLVAKQFVDKLFEVQSLTLKLDSHTNNKKDNKIKL